MEKRYNYKQAAELLDFPGSSRLLGKFLREMDWTDQSGGGNDDIVELGYITTELHTSSPTGNYAVHWRTFLTDAGIEYLRPLVEKHKEALKTKKRK